MGWDDFDAHDAWDTDFGNDIQNEVEIDFDEVKATTDKAILVRVGREDHWIPKSQIGELTRSKSRFASGGSLTIPEWLAEEKGLV